MAEFIQDSSNWRIFINGCYADSPMDIPVLNPSTEEVITLAPNADPSQVDEAVRAAKAAFPAWSALSGEERAVYLDKIAKAVSDRKTVLAETESRNNGKPLPEALWDLDDVSGTYSYYANLARELDTRQWEEVTDLPAGDYKAYLCRESVGVVAAIVPFNYPLLMTSWKIAPALAAGCTVVLKPSEVTPLTALMMGEVFQAVGLPNGVVNIVCGGAEVGSTLVNHPDIDKVTFTGSVPTGGKVMAAASKDIKNITLELGGKSCAMVFSSADVTRAVEWTMFGCFWTNGQICSATSRLLIQDTIYDSFLERLVEETNKIKIGNALDEGVKMGPLVCRAQYDKVLGFIERARVEGVTVLAGGQRPENLTTGFFLQPTILTDVAADSEVWTTEIFGPVLSVRKFITEEEAVAAANDSDYGLAGAVFSTDEEQLKRVTRALRTGVVWNNCSQPCFSQLPWGGLKKSGIGRDLGRAGFEAYLELKQVVKHVTENPLGWYDMSASKL